MENSDSNRRAIVAYMKRRGLTHAGWARAAGISSRTIPAFLAGRAKSLNHGTLQKLAEATGDPIPMILGEMPDKLEEKKSILNPPKSNVHQPHATLTEVEMQQLDALEKMLGALLKEQKSQTELLMKIAEAITALSTS